MTQENLQIKIANAAVQSIGSLNTTKQIDLYEKIRLAQEENDATVKSQKAKMLPHGLSAALTAICSIFGEVLKNAGNPLGEMLKSVGSTAPEVGRIYSTSLDGNITHHQHTTREAQVAQERIGQTENTSNSQINQVVTNISDMLRKEV